MYNDHSINKIKLPIIDSKSDLKEDLRSFPTCSPKVNFIYLFLIFILYTIWCIYSDPK